MFTAGCHCNSLEHADKDVNYSKEQLTMIKHYCILTQSEYENLVSNLGQNRSYGFPQDIDERYRYIDEEMYPLLQALERTKHLWESIVFYNIYVEYTDKAGQIIPILIEDLYANDEDIRAKALDVLGWFPDKAEAAVSHIIYVLEEYDDFWVRRNGLYILGIIGGDGALKYLRDKMFDEEYKDDFLRTYEWFATTSEQVDDNVIALALEWLTYALQDEDKDIRIKAIQILGKYGKRAEGAIDMLREINKDINEDSEIRDEADKARNEILAD